MNQPDSTQGSARTLIDELLEEQSGLTAVEQFSRAHDREDDLASHYRHLLPLSAPRPGEQYAFEVDLDRCSGCKGCVTACHSLNGLEENETWRETGLLIGESIVPSPRGGNQVIALQQTVTTACHHCVEPGCLLGCPVLAYDKDPVTGIVRHLDDQCIGCSYCILKCPYDVPKFSTTRGIVRKCDMCHGRLAVGEAPACVQACPNEAIRITVVGQGNVTNQYSRSAANNTSASVWLADSPEPNYTIPTTRYVTRQGEAKLHAADHEQLRPQPAHWPLIWMLVLTQAGIGCALASCLNGAASRPTLWPPLAASLVVLGLALSSFHLGQPKKAWRIWLGWRTSWLSREAIVLNILIGCTLLPLLPVGVVSSFWPAVLVGLVAVFAQSMVYADTHRQFWRLASAAPRFFGSVLVFGFGFATLNNPGMSRGLIAVTLCKLGFEWSVFKHRESEDHRVRQLRRTAQLQASLLRPILALRLSLGLFGGVFLPFAIVAQAISPAFAPVALAICFLAELAERSLFFNSVAPDRMPGNFQT